MQSVESKVLDSFEFLLPALVELKAKYTSNMFVHSIIQTVIFSMAALCHVLQQEVDKK